MIFRVPLPATLILALVALLTPAASAADGDRFLFTAFGCMPYRESSWPALERLVAEMNRHRPAFTVNLGDIKDGGEPPSESKLQRTLDLFNQFDGPLIYTPGDNEWTDVHRRNNGNQDPLTWLARIRGMFFLEERSLGRRTIALVSQRRQSEFARYVENNRWRHHGVIFATVHIVGSNNGTGSPDPGVRTDFAERQAAAIAWILEAFTEARKSNAPAIAFFCQADMFVQDYGRGGRDSGYAAILHALEEQSLRFLKPVLLVHADEHRFRVDQGHRFDRSSAAVPNFTRVGTFGDHDIHGVCVVVDPDSASIFLPGPLLVPGNTLPSLPSSPYSD